MFSKRLMQSWLFSKIKTSEKEVILYLVLQYGILCRIFCTADSYFSGKTSEILLEKEWKGGKQTHCTKDKGKTRMRH